MVAASKLPSAPSAVTPDLDHRLWSRSLTREHGFEPLEIDGKLPAELRGTLYRNGPGQFGQFGTQYSHPFEADGGVTAVRFENGKAFGAARITQSAGLVAERTAGKLLYGLSVSWPRRMKNLLQGRRKNTANTNVMMWQGRLFALMEGAIPTEIDAQTLTTRGETTFDGTIVSMFSAHPHRVASRRATYNFGLEYGRIPRIHTYELPDVGPARHLGAVELRGAPMLHDFIATDTHLVFFVSPTAIDLKRMFLQLGTFADMFQWKPAHGTEIICVPIDRPQEVVRFTTEAFYQWHFTNAFDRGRQIVVDYVRYPSFETFYEIGRVAAGGAARALSESEAHRAVIDLDAKTFRSEPTLERACEFPTVAPGVEGREHAVSYLALDSLAGIGKLTAAGLVEHGVPDTQRISEPLFVPRANAKAEDDGWLVALCHDGATDRAFVSVYDAAKIPDGPVARAWFDHQVPITFHGTFAPMK